MKKAFFSILLGFVATANLNAQAINPNPMATTPATQPENNAYWYYPSQNVYYNPAVKSYWYYDKSATKWVSGARLVNPYTPLLDNETKYKVPGKNVWKSNNRHKSKYKVKKDGTVKTKMKPAGN